MALTDDVAAHVMGELHTLIKKIDTQSRQVISTATVINDAVFKIKQNSDLAVENAREAVHQAQQESIRVFQAEMGKAVGKTLHEVAGAVATKSAVKWIMGGVALAGFLTVIAGLTGYSKGKDAGNSIGYAQARDEIAASAWANTPDGKLAYLLAKAGSLEKLAHCSGNGWKKEKGVCYVYAKNGETFGWYLP